MEQAGRLPGGETPGIGQLLVRMLRAYSRVQPSLLRSLSSTKESYEHCFNLVKKFDYENYLWCLRLPRGARDTSMVIRAWNIGVFQVTLRDRTHT